MGTGEEQMRILLTFFAIFLLPIQPIFAQDLPGSLGSVRPKANALPLALPWRDIAWPTLDYNRRAIPGGGGLYTLPSPAGRKFRIDAVFETGTFTLEPGKRTHLNAAMDLILLGGAGQRSFEQIQNYVLENGLRIDTTLTDLGSLRITVTGLSEDFSIGLSLLEDMLLRPRFDRDALELWKQEQVESFHAMLDASTNTRQQRFVEQESAKLVFGPEHYYSKAMERVSEPVIKSLKREDVIAITQKLINRAGMTLLLSGKFTSENVDKLSQLSSKIPRKSPMPVRWLPPRPASQPSLQGKIPMMILRKADMSQANISLRFYFPEAGRWNVLERTRLMLLSEIFSSSGGAVGNDRFSKALRAESGLSYSPFAFVQTEVMEPNTNVTLWSLNFQADNSKVGEALILALKTWNEFVNQGISQEELDRVRISQMNALMAQESTIFDRADSFLQDITSRMVPRSSEAEDALSRLELETDMSAVNATLKQLAKGAVAPGIVVMGNPTPEQFAPLFAQGQVVFVRDEPFEKIVAALRGGKEPGVKK
jgi:zinc protease